MSKKSSRNRARTRAVRAEMAETGENYTRVAARVDGIATPSSASGPLGRAGDEGGRDPAQVHVRRLLRAMRDDLDARLREVDDLENTGHRIVSGGPKWASDDEWEVHDARTGELLAEGAGGPRAYDDAWARLSRGSWVERDFIGDDDLDTPLLGDLVVTDGIPKGLGHALMEWLESSSTPAAEIAAFTGWSVDTVEECRTDLGSALREGHAARRPRAARIDEWDGEGGPDNPFPEGTDEHREHDLYMEMLATRDD